MQISKIKFLCLQIGKNKQNACLEKVRRDVHANWEVFLQDAFYALQFCTPFNSDCPYPSENHDKCAELYTTIFTVIILTTFLKFFRVPFNIHIKYKVPK